MHLHRSGRRSAAILYVCTAMCAAFLAFATVPSSAGASESVIEKSVVVNGVVKAHGVFYTNGNTFCTNMLNASGNGNWPYRGPWASTGIYVAASGAQIAQVDDDRNDGVRRCWTIPKGWDGTWLRMDVWFHQANGKEYREITYFWP